ncbi:uncharacterized protein LOC118263781 [Spodoptera frugiperda]|uniref:Gustatory receptor n=1 Tax=Spodoptera frugiperda TaxID=7108 RepID=A0A9R0CWR7_SPOFR|nr:uncharacterized protein LOC118263781 [Spodoptera frugiperda]
MKTTKDTKIEYLSKDIIEEEFTKSLRLMYRLQMLMASTRVDLKDRFVTTPSLLQKCHTMLSVVLLLGLDYIVIHKYDTILFDNETIYYLSSCVTGLQTLTFICNIIHVRFLNGDDNVEFFVKLQQIDRCMNIHRNKTVTALLLKTNIFSLAAVFVIFSVLVAIATAKGTAAFWPYIGIAYSQLNFVLELICCSNIFVYFYIRARFINSIIKNYLDPKKTQEILYSRNRSYFLFTTKTFMRRLAAQTHSFLTSDTDIYLKQLLDGFFKFQDIYKFQIFMFCCKLVGSSILTFEFMLFAVQNDTVGIWDSLTPSFFTIIDLVMALLLGIRCELFIREVKETKRLVIAVMSRHYDGRLREKSNRMLKLIEETPPHFSVYDMWQLDANVLLQMFMLVTGLIVTQMQFAFL